MAKWMKVEQMARDLAEKDSRLAPFSNQVLALSKAFDEEALVALLQHFMQSTRDAGHPALS